MIAWLHRHRLVARLVRDNARLEREVERLEAQCAAWDALLPLLVAGIPPERRAEVGELVSACAEIRRLPEVRAS